MENNNQLPQHLEANLQRALHDIACHFHEVTGASHIVLDMKYISDGILKVSQLLIGGAAMGVKVFETKADKAQELKSSDPSKLAQEAIERALNAAKKKEG